MKHVYLFILFSLCTLSAFTQKSTKVVASASENKKYVIKISPAVKFNFIAPKMVNNNYFLPYSTMSTGLSANFLMANKKNNYHDIGTSIEVIPVIIKKPQHYNTSNGYKIGFEYSYRFVFVVKKKPNVSFFTAVGTQTSFSKINSTTYNIENRPNVYSSKSFEQHAVFVPGIQYCKKNFFLDFSLPFGAGYNFTKQANKIGNPVLQESDTNKKFHLLNWNAGCKIGVGAKF